MEPDWPGQGFRGAEQLLQGTPVHILGHGKEMGTKGQGFSLYSVPATCKTGDTQEAHKAQGLSLCYKVPVCVLGCPVPQGSYVQLCQQIV